MNYGICLLSTIPVRKDPSEKAEMVSQLLFGETFMVIEETENWISIRCEWDDYEGWISRDQGSFLDQEEYERISGGLTGMATDILSAVHSSAIATTHRIVLGSSLPGISGDSFSIAGLDYTFQGAWHKMAASVNRQELILFAGMYLNSPYLWGGRTPFGIDCSGFTQVVYKRFGISLPRDSSQQAIQGKTINLLSESEPGDLLFFDNDNDEIIHAGIKYDDHSIIHASGKVRIDTLDHQGIFNEEAGRYTHKLRLIKRLLSSVSGE